MRRIVLSILLFSGMVGATPLRADTTPYRRYTPQDGLPNNRITALTQTNDGLLWIGTQHGLVLYDGHEFRPISLPDSIRQNSVLALKPMPDGSVWAGLGSDVVRIAPDGPIRSHLLDHHHVEEILRRDEQMVFVTHQAVWKQRAGQDTLSRTPFRYDRLDNVTQLDGADLGPKGNLWIANAERGPGRVQPDGRVVFADPPPPAPSEYRRNEEFFDLRFSPDGTALVARGAHLYRFDPESGSFTVVGDALGPIEEIHRQGRMAYLTWKAEVGRYDTQTRRVRGPIGATRDLPGITTTTALRDREGGLWIGTQGAGLLHFPAPEARHISAIDGQSIQTGAGFHQQGGTLWVNTWGDGLFQLRPQRRRVTPDGHTRWVMLRSHDHLYGLTAADTARGRHWYRWTPAAGWQFVSFARGAVRGYVDSSGVGYFWHNDGLYRHEPSGATTRRTRLRAWPLEESQHHLMGPAPNGDLLLFDQGDVLRLQRPDGAVLDTIATVPEHASSGGRRLTIDPKGRIWAPFASLLRIDPEQQTTQTLLKQAALENVQMAGDSLAMAKTNEGLYLLNARTGTVRRHLTEADGLLSNDVNGAHLMGDTLYVGHPSGLTLMPTDSLFAPLPRPQAVLTGLEINLKDRSLRIDSLFGESERAVGFSYTGASLTHPDRVRYEVRLAPRDTAWKTTKRHFTRYTNLDPGTYRFEVRTRLANQPPGPVAAYTFTIPPHFYETKWFQLLVVLTFFGLVLGMYRWRTYRLHRRKEKLKLAVEERTQEFLEEKKKTEQQAERLAELDEAKNRFFAHISHEFRTPLSLILGPIRNALTRASDGTATLSERHLRRMISNAERLQHLIDQLLDLATLEAGRMDLDRQPGDLASVVERSAEAFRSKAEQKAIDLRIERPADRIETRFDPEKVETIVSNLVGNAVKFTPDGGTVTVEVVEDESVVPVEAPGEGESAERTVRIEVEDTGPGIDPEVQERIFDRFEQSRQPSGSTTREHEGTGLGLALTSELVKLHGGTINVTSTPGEGSTFTVQLPGVPVATEAVDECKLESMGDGERGSVGVLTSESGWTRQRGGDGYTPPHREERSREEEATILIVEDNAEMRAYLREQLAGRWSVIEAADGKEGWEQVQEERPDLILSDVMMPTVDGFELCRRIKDDADLRTIPVLLLTARADEEATHEGLQGGADDYVEKPFDIAELRQRIENHLAARQHLEERYRQELEVESLGLVVQTEEQPFVESVIETTEAHLDDPDLTVEQLAEELALSRRQFTRRVKKAIGETPGKLIQRLRLKQAKALLRNEFETVSEVAYATGFRSPSSFSQSFQEAVGQSPSEYARKHAE